MKRLLVALTLVAACTKETVPPRPPTPAPAASADDGRYVVVDPRALLRFSPDDPIGMRAQRVVPPNMLEDDHAFWLFERVREENGVVELSTLGGDPPDHACSHVAPSLTDFELRLFVDRAGLAEITRRHVEVSYADGSRVELAAGVVLHPSKAPAPAGQTAFLVRVDRFTVPVHLPPGDHGATFEVPTPFAIPEPTGHLEAPFVVAGRTYPVAELEDEAGVEGVATHKGATTSFALHTACAVYHGRSTKVGPPRNESYGAGGLGLTGTSGPLYRVSAGTPLSTRGGRPVGKVRTDHVFWDRVEDDGPRACFVHPLGTESYALSKSGVHSHAELCVPASAVH
ncbi:MAG: hypothetical protein JSR82_12010 [Verrucomicrobia bacterium]|nr:hypothetical protein [Verrucomicrobiota bacterium]